MKKMDRALYNVTLDNLEWKAQNGELDVYQTRVVLYLCGDFMYLVGSMKPFNTWSQKEQDKCKVLLNLDTQNFDVKMCQEMAQDYIGI